jgi:hypothetical protein
VFACNWEDALNLLLRVDLCKQKKGEGGSVTYASSASDRALLSRVSCTSLPTNTPCTLVLTLTTSLGLRR